MKKLIILSLLFVLAFNVLSIAQNSAAMTVSDTITNAGTETAILKASGDYANVAFQAVVTKLSGTVAGTVILQGSIDGLNYVSIGSDTLTLTNVTTNTHIWADGASKYLYYKLKATGSGTMSATLKGWFIGHKL